MKYIHNESEEEKNIRQNLVVTQFQTDIEMQKIHATRHRTNYREIDQEMNDLLEQQFNEDMAGELEALWITDCKNQEAKSQDRWEAKK